MDWRDRLVIGRRGPGYTDQMLFDWWSLVHFTSGFILALIGLEFLVALALLILFEFWENSRFGVAFWRNISNNRFVPKIEMFESQAEYQGDSWGNLVFDVIFGVAGFYVAGLVL